MRDRLIELCENLILSCKSSLCNDCEHNKIDYPHCMSVHFADHLIANGVIYPPCKVGNRVYQTDGIRIYEHEVHDFYYHQNKLLYETEYIDFDDTAIGKSIFLSREDAEKALEEVQQYSTT